MQARNIALDALVDLIDELARAREAGLAGAALGEAQRKAQFFIDFVEAENSTGFHAPGEALRVITQALDVIRRGQLRLRSVRGAERADQRAGQPGGGTD